LDPWIDMQMCKCAYMQCGKLVICLQLRLKAVPDHDKTRETELFTARPEESR
jgi:hypothetical protein